VRRLNIFAKGNVDVRDSLLYSAVGGKIVWNGINEIVRSQFPGHVVRVRHETCTRSDALTATDGTVPADLLEQALDLGPYPAEAQFSRRVFTPGSDVVVLSLQPDLMTSLVRHRRHGYLLFPYGQWAWPTAQRQWLVNHFEAAGFLEVSTAMEHLAKVCQEIQASTGAHVLIYNVSAVVPGEQVHCYQGMGEAFATRIRRFNLALVELSERLGISVVDVDAVVARAGADRLKIDVLHVTAEGQRLVAEEVVRILQELGCFD
jgi:hypothetical protein